MIFSGKISDPKDSTNLTEYTPVTTPDPTLLPRGPIYTWRYLGILIGEKTSGPMRYQVENSLLTPKYQLLQSLVLSVPLSLPCHYINSNTTTTRRPEGAALTTATTATAATTTAEATAPSEHSPAVDSHNGG
ncbi:hypothetical protein ElyMa_006522100 [Elysia marginata]|uniref:Uncharacterized protein n=1 Tax=Elysia marginata TaxID=1093978 RepID=A0AAV4I591_9GAST|nr:hypothetical protein ElyMa_006522100 [Elysia marginata]